MHVPDGFLDLPTSIGTAAVATGAVALSLGRSRRSLDERAAPITGLVAVFIFAAQMFNFPVGAGTSGHLLGGALAAVLVGPWLATLAITTVLIVQALAFADGGLTALGTNVLLMGVVGAWSAWLVFRALMAVLPRSRAGVATSAGIAGFVSVPAAAATFTALFAIGGGVPLPIGSVLKAMLGWHAAIGVGEGLITAAVVGAVMATRPDLVYGAASLSPNRGSAGKTPPRDRSTAIVAVALSGVVATLAVLLASSSPDGLEHVAQTEGFASSATEHAASSGPFADYQASFLGGPAGGVVAGLVGIALVALVAAALTRLVARRRTSHDRRLSPR